MSNLTVLSVEQEISHTLSLEDVVDKFYAHDKNQGFYCLRLTVIREKITLYMYALEFLDVNNCSYNYFLQPNSVPVVSSKSACVP